MCNKIFTGSAVAIVTPMNDDGSVNYKSYENLLEFQISSGTDAIVVCGTTGESATLSDQEKHDLVKFTVDIVDGRVPVIAGTGSNDTKHAVELSIDAQTLNVDGLLIVSPYYNKTSQRGIVEHYTAIADSVSVPIIMYNVPSRTGCDIKPETCLHLSKHENIVAIKEASGNISAVSKIRALCGDHLDVYSGNDDQVIPMLALGALGVISVYANICPRKSHDIVWNFMNGHPEISRQLFFENLSVIESLFCDVNPIPVKTALNFMGFNCGQCRLPLTSLSEENSGEILRLLRQSGENV